MRNLFRVSLVAASATAITVGLTLPASAIDGSVFSRAVTPGYNDAGGTISADIVFNASDHTRVSFNNLKVNDTCPADGNWAGGRVVVMFTDGTVWRGPNRLDTGGCTSAQPAAVNAPFDGSRPVAKAGVQALVMSGTNSSDSDILEKGGIDWRDNPYTTAP